MPIATYQLDLTGTAQANKITGEVRVITNPNQRVFMPTGGSFYSKSLVIKKNGVLANPIVDYVALSFNRDASIESGKEVCDIIYLKNDTVNNWTLTYQVIGGNYQNLDGKIADYLNTTPLNALNKVSWASILGKPQTFPPSTHQHFPYEWQGYTQMIALLERLRQATIAGDSASFGAVYQYIDNNIESLTKAHLDGYVGSNGILKIGSTKGILTGDGTTATPLDVDYPKLVQALDADYVSEPEFSLHSQWVNATFTNLSNSLNGEASTRYNDDQAIITRIDGLVTSIFGNFPNMLPNGSFENGMNNWYTNAPTYNTSTDPHGWGNILIGATPPNGTYTVDSGRIAVVPGLTYTLTGDSMLFADSGFSCFDVVGFATIDSNTVVYDGPEGIVSGPHDFDDYMSRRTAHAVQFTVPQGCYYVSVRYIFSGTNIQAWGCRRIKLSRGTTITSYDNAADMRALYIKIAAEIADRINADQFLNNRIDSLITTVNNETAARVAADQFMVDRTNTLAESVYGNYPNMLPNGSFENGIEGWFVNAPHYGAFMDNNGWGSILAGNTPPDGTYTVESVRLRVAPGLTYTLTGDSMLLATSGYCGFDVIGFPDDVSNTVVYDGPEGIVTGQHDFSDDVSRRTAHAVQFTVPGNCNFVIVRFIFSGTGISNWGCRRIKLSRGNVITAYDNAADMRRLYEKIASEKIDRNVADQILVNRIDFVSTAATSEYNDRVAADQFLNSRIDAAFASIDNEFNARVAADQFMVNRTDTLASSVYGNYPNMLPNGSFENGMDNWSTNAPGAVTHADINGWGNMIGGNNPPNGTYTVDSGRLPVAPGATYTLTGDSMLFADSGFSCFDVVGFADANSNQVIYDGPEGVVSGQHDFSDDVSRRAAHAVQFTVPGNCNFVSVRYIFSGTNIRAWGCRRIKLSRGSAITAYDNAADMRKLYEKIATEKAAREQKDAALDQRIDNISLASGPQGPEGPQGPQGPAGANGSDASVTIVDNLTSTSTTSALSANQGKVLKDMQDTFQSKFNNYLAFSAYPPSGDQPPPNTGGGTSNIAIGGGSVTGSTGVDIAIGIEAQATGFVSIAIGSSAIASGMWGIAMGGGAKVTDDFGIAIGGSNCQALAGYSIAMGYQAKLTAVADYSTVVGPGAYSEGPYSVAVGRNAFVYDSGGVAIGANSITNGLYAASVGDNSNAAGDYSVALGHNSFVDTTYSYSSALGYAASVSGSNQLQLGNSSCTSYAYGAVQNRSDARDKTDVQDCDLGLEFINSLTPRKYKWDYREDYAKELFVKPPKPDLPHIPEESTDEDIEAIHLEYQSALNAWTEECGAIQAQQLAWMVNPDKDGSKVRNRFHYGLIAQEFKEVLDILGVDCAAYQDHSVNGGVDVKSLGYTELIAPMIKAIQQLSEQNQALTARLSALEAKG